jgi:hypothetical protein
MVGDGAGSTLRMGVRTVLSLRPQRLVKKLVSKTVVIFGE